MVLNFLNTIYSLSQVGKNEQIGEFSILLMNYFRYVLRQNVDLVPVKEELDFVRNYLEIQKMRFPNSFTCVYSMEPEAENIPIPQLLIENCVENAVKYGLIMGSEIEKMCIRDRGISAEVVTIVGENVRKVSDAEHTIMITHAQGCMGYVPDDWEYEHQSFVAGSSLIEKGCAEPVFIRGFEEMFGNQNG